MGWYDAFKGDTSSVSSSKRTNKEGLAYEKFGDAFKDIGKAMNKDEQNQQNQQLRDIQQEQAQSAINKNNLDIKIKNAQIDKNLDSWVQEEDNKDYLRDAFSSNTKEEFTQKIEEDNTNIADAQTIAKADKYFQNKFNNEAIQKSTKSNTWGEFVEANPTLVENADGKTINSIKKQYSDTGTQISKLNKIKNELSTQELKTKHQQSLLKKEQEISKIKGNQKPTLKPSDIKSVQSFVKEKLGKFDSMSGEFSLDPNNKELKTQVPYIETQMSYYMKNGVDGKKVDMGQAYNLAFKDYAVANKEVNLEYERDKIVNDAKKKIDKTLTKIGQDSNTTVSQKDTNNGLSIRK